MATTMQPRWTSQVSTWVAALIVTIALILMFAAIALNGTPDPAGSGSVIEFEGHPERIEETVPAYIQESIVFGERAPGDVASSAQIMPVYLVEDSYFGE